MEKLIIDRSKWRTGGSPHAQNKNVTGRGGTLLCNDMGFMCCLGFESIRIGATEEQILGLPSPDRIRIPLLNLTTPNPMFDANIEDSSEYQDTPFSIEAMQINDDTLLTAEEREKAIKLHFASAGIEVEFIGEYVKP